MGSHESYSGPTMTRKMLVNITEISCSELPTIGLRKRPGKFYVKLSVDQNSKTSSVSRRGNTVSWNDSFQFDDIQNSSLLDLQVYAQRTIGTDDYVGELKKSIENLFSNGVTTVVTHKLCKNDKKGTPQELSTVIKFTISAFETSHEATIAQMDEAVVQAKAAYEHIGPLPSAAASACDAAGLAIGAVPQVNDVITAWEPLLEKVKVFTEIMDKFVEVHPYAKMAWTVLSAVHKAFLAQKFRDESIDRLVDVMNDTLGFVHETEPLKKIESHKPIVVHIIQQTTECGYFIRDYSKTKGFGKRAMKNLVSDVDDKVEQFRSKFSELRLALQERAIVQTEISVFRVLETVDSISAEITLGDMPYAEGARYNSRKGCLPGTRREIIEEIVAWVNNDAENVPRVLLLTGMAGLGKSAIAHSLAHLFDDLGRLGSSYCFDRANQAKLRPDNLFSTIARDLADLDPERKSTLCRVIHGKTALRNTRAPHEQFEKFILQPATGLTSIGPLLIVIDAMDESGDKESRQVILSILANKAADLPSNFRILITARAEQDILKALEKKQHVVFKHMDTVDAASTTLDISRFVQTQLDDTPKLERRWPNNEWCRLLVEHSEGVFQWASTACRFIRGDGEEGLDPVEHMEVLLSSTSRSTQLNLLDQLYTGILTQKFKTENETRMRRFKSIMGMVMVSREPLSMFSLENLYCEEDAVALIIRPLGPLLSGVADETFPVRPLHTSFRDFLIDKDRAGIFFIDVPVHHRNLLLSCFRVMKAELRFNICGLKTSYHLNNELMMHHARNAGAITPYLSYACRFGTDHLVATNFDKDLADEVHEFLHIKLLFWLEVLSLEKAITVASKGLLSIVEWSKDGEITAFATDAQKFVATFGSVISQSAPHIYLSALPFAPEKSLVSLAYLPRFPRVLRVQYGKVVGWPATQNVLEGHNDAVNSVAFSPDRRHIVSGSDDATIRVWDAETGDVVSGPFEGHTSWINSVAFSPDGKHIVSGSRDRTIRVWDVETGDVVLGPFEGHTDWVNSVAYSPNGKYIISGSDDKTIRVWDAEKDDPVSRLIQGHTDRVNSVAFSPNGERITSGSYDETIRVWDIVTGDLVLKPFKGHTGPIMSVSFSPDGKHIVSGSGDQTTRVWDAETGDLFLGPLTGHTHWVNAVTFSPDGKHIFSGSADDTIMVWDAKTGDLIPGLFEGHTSYVNSVAFSPDGKHIVSGSRDKTIRVWDVTGDVVSKPVDGHTDWVTSVSFSPDGKYIVSASRDETIRVWNAETSDLVLGPFKGHSGTIDSVSFSPDGKHIVSGCEDKTIRVWDATTGDLASGPFKGHTEWIQSVAFSPDGKRIVSGAMDDTIRMWDAETGDLVLGPLEGHTHWVVSVAFSPDGKQIVSGSVDGTVRVWDSITGDLVLGPFKGHDGWVRSVAFSPDGKQIVSGSYDKTIRVWDAEKDGLVLRLIEGHTGRVTSVSFSPDGKTIASGSEDNTIRVWDVETGDLLSGPFEGHADIITSVAFSSDGKHIVSGSCDKTIRVWEANSTASKRGFSPSSRTENKWIHNGFSEPLFWVPPWSRACLWRPNNVTVIGQASTKLDVDCFVCGTSWEQCGEPITLLS